MGPFAPEGVIPVIRIDDVAHADPLARALVAGGLSTAEVTFRTAAAAAAITAMSTVDGLTVGAGTVLSPAQADEAVAAGAHYVVTPGFSDAVVGHCTEIGVPIVPGCATATDLSRALEVGISTVKFFPAEAMGGVKTIAALAAPFGSVRFVPTGGVSPANMADYLSLPSVLAVGGSWMVAPRLLSERDFDAITRLTREAVDAAAAAVATGGR